MQAPQRATGGAAAEDGDGDGNGSGGARTRWLGYLDYLGCLGKSCGPRRKVIYSNYEYDIQFPLQSAEWKTQTPLWVGRSAPLQAGGQLPAPRVGSAGNLHLQRIQQISIRTAEI